MLHHLPKKCLKNLSPWIWVSWPLLFKNWHEWQLLYRRSWGLSKSSLFLRPGHLHRPVPLNSIRASLWKRRQSGGPYKTCLSPWHKQYCAIRQSRTKHNLSLCFPKDDMPGLCTWEPALQEYWPESLYRLTCAASLTRKKKHTTGTSLWRGDKCPH